MSPTLVSIPFMTQQMRMCGAYHVGRSDNAYGAIETKANRLLNSFWRATTMAKNVSKNYPNKANWNLRFLNQKLTQREKEVFEEWFADREKCDLAVIKAMHDGYKISVQWQSDNEIFNALLYPPKDGSANDGMAISSKSADWYKASAMLVFKHAILTRGDWGKFYSEGEEEG